MLFVFAYFSIFIKFVENHCSVNGIYLLSCLFVYLFILLFFLCFQLNELHCELEWFFFHFLFLRMNQLYQPWLFCSRLMYTCVAICLPFYGVYLSILCGGRGGNSKFNLCINYTCSLVSFINYPEGDSILFRKKNPFVHFKKILIRC